MMLRELTKKDIKKSHGMTVKELLKFIEEHNIPLNAKIMIQRVKDSYFNDGSWGVYLKEGEFSMELRSSQKTKEGKNITEEQILDAREQYHPAWSCVNYKDDKDLLFIDLQY